MTYGALILTKDCTWTSVVGALSPRSWTAREQLTPGAINYWELRHLYTDPIITQLLTGSTPGHFTQTRSKTETQKQSSTDRSPTDSPKYTTSHSPAHQKGKEKKRIKKKPYVLPLEYRNKSPLTRSQHKPLNQPFPPRAKTKKQMEYNPKSWEEETSSGASQKKWKYKEIHRKWKNKVETHKTK